MTLPVIATMALGFGVLCAAPAMAQDGFYTGKVVNMIIGANAGGANDAYARLVAKHMPRYIEGKPTFVIRNMGGAGGAVAAASLYGPAEQDGSTIGMVTRALMLEPLMSERKFPFDIQKFNWLGSLNKEHTVVIVNHDAPAVSIEQARQHEVLLAAAGTATEGVVYPNLMNSLAGTKFRVIAGYAGSDEMMLAMERREVHGRGGVGWSAVKLGAASKLAAGEIKIMAQLALQRHADLPNVPMLLDYVKNQMDRQVLEVQFTAQEMGRPFLLPPGVPPHRVAMLRKAFNQMAADPEFLADAAKQDIEIDLLTGDEMHVLLNRVYTLPADVIQASRRMRERG